MKNPVTGTFRSLRSFNFRLWTAGALVSNAGTGMQRVAQDWLVLTQLTHHDASALGIHGRIWGSCWFRRLFWSRQSLPI
jgi:hypothetical protein